MLTELEVLAITTARLEATQIEYIKLDFIVCKRSEYRQLEFSRRQRATISGVHLWIVSREDLILSKLVWSKDSGSELQRRDARSLFTASVDRAYLEKWATDLGVADLLQQVTA